MIHDPLCPVVKGCVCGEPDDYLCCQCDLIREVREDQDRRHVAAELTRLGQEMGLTAYTPTVPREDRAKVLDAACSRLTAKVTAYESGSRSRLT